jgi:hypothetical protein
MNPGRTVNDRIAADRPTLDAKARSSRRRRQIAAAFVTCTTLMLTTPTEASGDALVILVNARNTQNIDASDAKKLFVGETLFWPGNLPVHPILRPAETPAGVAFYQALRVAPSRFKRIWQEKQLSGQAQSPQNIATAPLLIAKIATDAGAIGFVLAAELPPKMVGVRAIVLH